MEIQEQALLSGLVFADEKDKIEPQWRPPAWPSLLGGNRGEHTSVVVPHPVSKHHETVVIIGGVLQEACSVTNSVILLCGDRAKWQQGPPMQESRNGHVSVVCNGAVYAIGGYNRASCLDSIERIHVWELFQHLSSSSAINANGWMMLNCRLSTKREGCAAAVVHDRFIVVAGGFNGLNDLSSVDILDTTCGNPCTVTSGPSLGKPRSYFGMAVIRQRIYAVGGINIDPSNSVEYLEFGSLLDDPANNAESVFALSKSWTIHEHLSLKSPRELHAVVQVGSCLVVAGGFTHGEDWNSVQVLDADKRMCWELPNLKESRYGCSMVSMSNGISVIGGNGATESCETLSLVDKSSQLFARLLEMGKVPVDYRARGKIASNSKIASDEQHHSKKTANRVTKSTYS